MSSRLFQRVREELALAYTVFSFQSFYSLAGLTGVFECFESVEDATNSLT